MASKTDKYGIQFDIKGLEKLEKYQRELRQVNQKLKEHEKATKNMKKLSFVRERQLSNLTAAQDRLKKKIKESTNALKANRKELDLNKKAGGMSAKAMAAMGLSITGAVMALKRLSQFLITSVKDFAAFEKGVKNVTTLMSQDETNLLSTKLYDGVLDISKEFGFQLEDINKAMFNAVSAGIKGGEALEFLGVASKLAMAGVTDLKSATLGLTTVLNAYNMETSEAQKVSEILFTTQKFGVTTVEELSKSLGVVVPFAAASGISLEELGAAIATTTRSGLDAAKTVTALRAAISQMQKPAAESRDLFLQYGIPIGAAEMKAVGFTETLRRLNKVYQESPEIIEQMFGNVRGLTAIFSLAGENADQYNEILSKTTDETERAGNLTKGTTDLLESMDTKINRLTASYKDFKIAIGDSQFFKFVVDAISKDLKILSSEYLTFFDKINVFLSQDSILRIHDVRKAADEANTALSEMRDVVDSGEDVNILGMLLGAEGVPEEEMARVKEVIGFARIAQSEAEKAAASGIPFDDDFTSKLSTLTKEYDDYLAGIKAATDAQNLDEKNADDAKAKLKRQYNELELEERQRLAQEIEILTMDGIEADQYQSVTSLEIAKAKYVSLQILEHEYTKNNNASAAERTRVEEAMAKLRVDIRRKEIALAESNTKEYNDTQTDLATDLAKKKQKMAEDAVNDDAVNRNQLTINTLREDEKYYETLLMLDGQSADEREKNERALAAVRLKLAKLGVKNTRENEQLKAKYTIEALNMIGDAVKANAEATLENRERQLDKEMQMTDEELESGLINNREHKKKQEEIEKEKFEMRKEHEKKMLKISLAQELANIAVQAAANPLAPITFGAASISQYAVMSALALARHAINLATIDKQKFALGGMVYGKSHSQGGETFAIGGRLAELEGGEAVINRRSTAMFGNTLSAMNVAGGGVSFASPNLGGNNELIDYNKIGEVIGRNTNVVLPVENLNKVQNRVKTTQNSVKF